MKASALLLSLNEASGEKNPIEVFSLRLFVRLFPGNLRQHYSFCNDADIKDGDS